MNIEKVNSIAHQLTEDFQKTNLLNLFQKLISTLSQVVSQPNQPQHQTSLSAIKGQLYDAIDASIVNTMAPSWFEAVNLLKQDVLLGNDLRNKIDAIFADNTITPASAQEELQQLFNSTSEIQKGLQNLVAGLDLLDIEEDVLADDEYEISTLIPRKEIDNTVKGLSKELSEFDFILKHLNELLGKDSEKYTLRTLSTTDPLISVIAGINLAVLLGRIVSWVLDQYKKILEIKKLRKELQNNELPEDILEGIKDYCDKVMTDKIDEFVKQLEREYKSIRDAGRKNEIMNGVRISINKIANRIDSGFNYEVRMPVLEEPDLEDYEETPEVDPKIVDLQKYRDTLQYRKTTDDRILSLPEKNINPDKK